MAGRCVSTALWGPGPRHDHIWKRLHDSGPEWSLRCYSLRWIKGKTNLHRKNCAGRSPWSWQRPAAPKCTLFSQQAGNRARQAAGTLWPAAAIGKFASSSWISQAVEVTFVPCFVGLISQGEKNAVLRWNSRFFYS